MSNMKNALPIISYVGLALTVLPGFLVFFGFIDMKAHYILMTAGMLAWFGTAPFWMSGPSLEDNE